MMTQIAPAFPMRLLNAFPRARSALLAPHPLAPFSTSTKPHVPLPSAPQPLLSAQRAPVTPPIALGIRHASIDSTTPTTSTSTATIPPSGATPTSSPSSTLSWNEFFRLRKIRRYYNFVASIGTSLSSLMVGTGLLAQQNLQTLGQTMFGLDPMVVMGLWTVGFAGTGWLIGPVVGSTVFRVLYRGERGQMALKERNFFERVRQYRVDPTSSSMSNPVPDYYGEKITSVQGYRRWLKDQRAFNKKRQRFV